MMLTVGKVQRPGPLTEKTRFLEVAAICHLSIAATGVIHERALPAVRNIET